ncbi:MAG TPA: isopentenyl-diphosphate delta-isomerase [Saprospiraceae bacterium]|nr:isopentenyl-diphosphate delta-isomerase [Saprospiraceae bacterium]
MAKNTKITADRKRDHIELAFDSQTLPNQIDARFYYEPALSAHPANEAIQATPFGTKTLSYPIWVSSMTGGTGKARTINHNLARACREFGLGFGLGSCRKLIDQPELLPDFDVRELIGEQLPFYANLGIAQIEQWLANGQQDQINKIVKTLRADGLIIHINPLQEYMQVEGDRFRSRPLDSIRKVLELFSFPVIVKEVGQGMGPESLKALLELPLQAIEFGAFGGTNFSILELQRQGTAMDKDLFPLTRVGHTAEEMVGYCNDIAATTRIFCKQLIISGGVSHFLDGYYLIRKSKIPAVYGQASSFLKYAMDDYEQLRGFIQTQIRGLNLAYSFLKIKS